MGERILILMVAVHLGSTRRLSIRPPYIPASEKRRLTIGTCGAYISHFQIVFICQKNGDRKRLPPSPMETRTDEDRGMAVWEFFPHKKGPTPPNPLGGGSKENCKTKETGVIAVRD